MEIGESYLQIWNKNFNKEKERMGFKRRDSVRSKIVIGRFHPFYRSRKPLGRVEV
jgi:hypothetical protein